MTNNKRRKRQLRRQIRERERQTIVLSRKVARRLLGKDITWVEMLERFKRNPIFTENWNGKA